MPARPRERRCGGTGITNAGERWAEARRRLDGGRPTFVGHPIERLSVPDRTPSTTAAAIPDTDGPDRAPPQGSRPNPDTVSVRQAAHTTLTRSSRHDQAVLDGGRRGGGPGHRARARG